MKSYCGLIIGHLWRIRDHFLSLSAFRNVWKSGGASRNPRSFQGEGLTSIPAKILGGNGSDCRKFGGASDISRSFEGLFLASNPAKIWGGNLGICCPCIPGSDGPDFDNGSDCRKSGWESSNPRPFDAEGFDSIFAKICGGNGSNWPPCIIGSNGSDLEFSSFLTEFFFGQFVRTTLAKVISHSSILSSFPVKWSLKKGRMGYYLVEKFFEWLKLVSDTYMIW